MRPLPETSPSRLATVLHDAVTDLHRESGADLASLYLYDADGRRYYAPFAVGMPQDSLVGALKDMREQLARYLDDLAAGKVPGDLRPQHYGTTVWLTVMRQPLVARDATSEVDSTFVRRHQVQAIIGLPLVAGDRVLGIVFLNYKAAAGKRRKAKVPDDAGVAVLEGRAAAHAAAIDRALAAAERAALEGLSRMTAVLASPRGGAADLHRLLSIGLADL
ncbi:MAG: GAF domain-containing protein, partial [Chloroflexota bacterium]